MENQKSEKIVVAYRQKKKSHKTGLVLFFVLAAIVFTVVGLICLIKKDAGLTIVGIVLCVLAVAYLLLIFVIVKRANIIERVNKYPKIAMVVYGQYLCIIRDQIEKIKLSEIQKVSKSNDMATGLLVRVRKSSGCITIRANNKNYNVYQIVNVDASKDAIKHYVDLAKSK